MSVLPALRTARRERPVPMSYRPTGGFAAATTPLLRSTGGSRTAASDAASTSRLARSVTGTSLVAGVSWTALAADSIARPRPLPSRTVAWYVPWLATTAAVAGLQSQQPGETDPLESAGYRLQMAGAPLIAAGNLLSLRPGGQPFAAAAALVWTAGLVLFGVGRTRAGRVPRWLGPAIAASQPLVAATAVAMSRWVPLAPQGSYSGALVHGLVWLGAAQSLHQLRSKGDLR